MTAKRSLKIETITKRHESDSDADSDDADSRSEVLF
jgi:hypothetical protein